MTPADITLPLREMTAMTESLLWPLLRISGLLLVLACHQRCLCANAAAGRAGRCVGHYWPLRSAVATGWSQIRSRWQRYPVIAAEIALGVAMGFALKMVLDAVALGGQSIALSMGLGFAMFIDSARGINVPVVSQFLMLLATLIFLALDGHISALEMLIASYGTVPIGTLHRTFATIAGSLLDLSTIVFTGAVQIALPAVAALAIVNIAFGVMSRAAPTLNLFAVGFPGVVAVRHCRAATDAGWLQRDGNGPAGTGAQLHRRIWRWESHREPR